VLAYPRLQARWGLGEDRIREFVSRVSVIAEIVHTTTTPEQVVPADPDDDPMVQTAVLGGADVLCTRDAHLLDASMDDLERHHILTGRPERS